MKPKEQKFIKIEAPFIDEIAGLTIIKMLDRKAQNTMMLKFKFIWNLPTLDVTNNSLETIIFDPKEMLPMLDLRLIGYYWIKQVILQQNLNKYYRFKSADILCEQFNTLINTLKELKDEMKEKYPWLEPDNERRNMSDREILERYIDLDKSCLIDPENEKGMDMLYKYYKYKDTFSLMHEITYLSVYRNRNRCYRQIFILY